MNKVFYKAPKCPGCTVRALDESWKLAPCLLPLTILWNMRLRFNLFGSKRPDGLGGFTIYTSKRYQVGGMSPQWTRAAAFFAGVPNRIHMVAGQVWATRRGIMRRLLRWMDRLIFQFSTWCYVDSHSQREFLLKERVVTDSASSVLLSGSISGIDVKRFAPSTDVRMKIRNDLNISGDLLVFFF